jgi:hypothetical protein
MSFEGFIESASEHVVAVIPHIGIKKLRRERRSMYKSKLHGMLCKSAEILDSKTSNFRY